MQTSTETHGTENTSKLRARLDEIKKLRGEIRQEIDLAENEVREGFLKIEPAVDKAEHELTHMAGDAAEAVAKTMDSLAESLHKIRARIKK
jgi:hypothetical protein